MTTTGIDALPAGYGELLAALKARVRATQFRAARAANTEVLRLYWSIGRDILHRQGEAGWGSKVVIRLAADLHREFPDQRGWSRSNLLYMRRAAEVWPTEEEFVQQVAGRLPWTHVHVLLDRLATRDDRDWYAAASAQNVVVELKMGAFEPAHLGPLGPSPRPTSSRRSSRRRPADVRGNVRLPGCCLSSRPPAAPR